MPFVSSVLRSARLIKNARLETTVEIHSDPLSGSLRIAPEAVSEFTETTPRDQDIINSLAGLHSFDVYSLRSNLKRLGIEVSDAETLELSDDMKEGLSIYSLELIRPLVERLFGRGREDLNTAATLQAILRDPDVSRVRENLRVMSEKTGIPLEGIPKFLEDYSDLFLSVAYYRYTFESAGPDVDRFLFWMREAAPSPGTLAQCREVEETLRFLVKSIDERLGQFQASFQRFWADISRESFLDMRRRIEDNHAGMGSVLCGLIVKMSLWKKEFPDSGAGSPSVRAKFVGAEMEPGHLKLKSLENEARRRLGLPVAK
jgi:hypothetical protein